MVLIPQCNIVMGQFEIDYLAEVNIVSTWRNLTDTATIKFPKQIKYQDKPIDQVLFTGDAVKIDLWFDSYGLQPVVNKPLFDGFINTIQPKRPAQIECDDAMYNLKKKGVEPKGWKDTTINEILKYIGITNFKTFGEMHIGEFSISDHENNVGRVLAKIKECTKFPVFFRNGVLNFGNEYDSSTAAIIELEVGKNIVKHDLEYVKKESINLEVNVVNHLLSGKKTKYKAGFSGGDSRTLNVYNMSPESVKLIAEQEISKKRFDGLKGKLTVLGNEFRQGDIVSLVDPVDGEIVGKYFTDQVETFSGANGLYQVLETGPKAA
jgi:hypothetical protein